MKKIIAIAVLSFPVILALMAMNPGFSNGSNEGGSNQQQSTAGEKVYKKYCLTCHQADGGGVPNMTPPLIQTSFVLGNKDTLINIVLHGLKNTDVDDETYNNPMPALGPVLKDKQIADVLTYIRNSFGNKASAVTIVEVKAARGKKK